MDQLNFWNSNAQKIINCINVVKLKSSNHKKRFLIDQINSKPELFYLKQLPLAKLNTILLTVFAIVKRKEAEKWKK